MYLMALSSEFGLAMNVNNHKHTINNLHNYEHMPKFIGIRKQMWTSIDCDYCEAPYETRCKLCLITCVNRKGKTRSRCGFKKAGK